MVEIERPLGPAQILVDALQRGEIKPVLAAEIVIDHPLVGARPARDLVDPRRRTGPWPRIRAARRPGSLLGCGRDRGRRLSTSAEPPRRRIDRVGSRNLSSPVTTQLPRTFAARRERRNAPNLAPDLGAQHDDHRESRRRGPRRPRARRIAGRGAEDHLHAQLGRGRRSRALFLRAEDGPVQAGRPRRRLRDRPRLRRLGAEGRRRPIAARPLRHGGRAACSAARAPTMSAS